MWSIFWVRFMYACTQELVTAIFFSFTVIISYRTKVLELAFFSSVPFFCCDFFRPFALLVAQHRMSQLRFCRYSTYQTC